MNKEGRPQQSLRGQDIKQNSSKKNYKADYKKGVQCYCRRLHWSLTMQLIYRTKSEKNVVKKQETTCFSELALRCNFYI